MKFHNLEDNFLEKYNPGNLKDYMRLRWRKAGLKKTDELHDRVLFQVINKGRLSLYFGKSKYELSAGEGFFLDLNENNIIKVEDWQEFDASTVLFSHKIINKFDKAIRLKDKDYFEKDEDADNPVAEQTVEIVPNLITISPKMLQMVDNVITPFEHDVYGAKMEALINSKILLLHLLRINNHDGSKALIENALLNDTRGQFPDETKKRMQIVCEYINENIHKNISTNELADLVEINKFYFSRLFKESMKKTPQEYIAEIKAEKAKHLLGTSNLPIKRIAYDLGFSSVSSFSQFFSRVVNVSPKKYREYSIS